MHILSRAVEVITFSVELWLACLDTPDRAKCVLDKARKAITHLTQGLMTARSWTLSSSELGTQEARDAADAGAVAEGGGGVQERGQPAGD